MKKVTDVLDKSIPLMTYLMVVVMIIIAVMIFYNIFYNLGAVMTSGELSNADFISNHGKSLIDGIMVLFVVITLIAAVLVYAKYGSEKGMVAILIAAIVAVSRTLIVEPDQDISLGILILLIVISLILLRKYY
ncbi:MAG: hypothetical protein CVT90_02540 [Candidatus Altiarchaeales archaeon HGW-Altiarchaeales-3]|nr:MAG: hypothetical protein CVT90_02540 [Candidatus Altiarchaeales archaeon HGW-Altiarchaeales-3]